MPQDDVDRDVGQKDGEGHPFDTEFLDDTDDAHALMFGIWKGVRSMKPRKDYKESKQNPHYHMLGYIVGWLLKLGVIAVMGKEYVL